MKYKYRIVELNNGEFRVEIKPRNLFSFLYSWNYCGQRDSKEECERLIETYLNSEKCSSLRNYHKKVKKVIKVYG
jgi:hypothetical protein